MKKSATNSIILQRWSIVGFFVIVILGTVYHFAFEWSNQSPVLGAIFPVNESVWEHLKLALSSVLTFSLVEFPTLRKTANNYFFAKAIGILLFIATILIVYYTYTGFMHDNYLLLDIGSFVIGALVCQVSGYKLFHSKPSRLLNGLGIIMIVATIGLFTVCTYYPPHFNIFKDTRTDTYGIKRDGLH